MLAQFGAVPKRTDVRNSRFDKRALDPEFPIKRAALNAGSPLGELSYFALIMTRPQHIVPYILHRTLFLRIKIVARKDKLMFLKNILNRYLYKNPPVKF